MKGTRLREGLRAVRARMRDRVRGARRAIACFRRQAGIDAEAILHSRRGARWRESGQGTTEYAILVGVQMSG